MTDIAELAEAVRGAADYYQENLLLEAADALEALQARIDEALALIESCDFHVINCDVYVSHFGCDCASAVEDRLRCVLSTKVAS